MYVYYIIENEYKSTSINPNLDPRSITSTLIIRNNKAKQRTANSKSINILQYVVMAIFM